MAQDPVPQPPVVGPLAGDGSTASPEEKAAEAHDPADPKSPAKEQRSFVAAPDLDDKAGPAGLDGDDDPDDRGAAYAPDVGQAGPARPGSR